jgi:hypothetical protein
MLVPGSEDEKIFVANLLKKYEKQIQKKKSQKNMAESNSWQFK